MTLPSKFDCSPHKRPRSLLMPLFSSHVLLHQHFFLLLRQHLDAFALGL
ncbi:MAG: hypothetical protein RMX65_009330 [Nostoc sp. DedQUE01]